MRKSLTFALFCLATILFPCLSAYSQSIPAGVGSAPNIGFELPQLGGSFNYSLNAAELVSTGFYNSGTVFTTTVSGDAAYLSGSTLHPFSAIYSGGVLLANSGQPNTVYQSLALSQGYTTKYWNIEVQDAVSYLPESPVSGLSGIPGVGDLGIDPVPIGSDAGIGILTTYGPRVSNTVTGSVSRVIGAHLSAQGNGYEGIQRFVGDFSNQGVDNTSEGGTAGLSYHFNARSAVSGNYSYTKFDFTGTTLSFSTQSGTIDYARKWSRRISTDVYAGPQYISSTGPGSGQPSTQLAAGASATYTGRNAFYSIAYSRGVNNGSGVVVGSFSDNIVGTARKQYGRNWSLSGTVGYSRSTGLPSLNVATFTSDGVSVGGQVVRALGRKFAAYGSYTIEDQSTTGSPTILGTATALNAFNGFYQVFGIGISYSPGSLFLRK